MPQPPITPELLLAFAADELDPAAAAAVASHLTTHSGDADLVALYRRTAATVRRDDAVDPPAPLIAAARALFTAPAPALPRWFDTLTQVVADLVMDSREHAVALRAVDAAERVDLEYEIDDVTIALQARRRDAAGDRWHLALQAECDDDTTCTAAVIIDTATGHPVATLELDDTGFAQLDLDGGTFAVYVHAGARCVSIESISLP